MCLAVDQSSTEQYQFPLWASSFPCLSTILLDRIYKHPCQRHTYTALLSSHTTLGGLLHQDSTDKTVVKTCLKPYSCLITEGSEMLIVLCVWACFHPLRCHDFVCASAAFKDGKPQHSGDWWFWIIPCLFGSLVFCVWAIVVEWEKKWAPWGHVSKDSLFHSLPFFLALSMSLHSALPATNYSGSRQIIVSLCGVFSHAHL